MANCNCNDFPISCAPHAPGGDCHPHGCPPHPCPPPKYKPGTSMYIGARYVPIFADPVEWDDEREYEPLTIVIHDGDCYTSKCYVPKGAQLPPYPEGQTKYWVKTSDYNYQFADLKKTVLDLSQLVEQFQKDNKDFTDLINGWNEKVQQWETEMTAWGERLDTVESNITDLTASLNAEIDRAKAAEQANAAAIAKETTDRQQAISELDAAYKAADTALSNRITANKTDIDAIKAEQVIQNTNITNNAKNISENSAEIAKHAARLTSLESNASDWDDAFPDTTIAQEVQKEELARANADTALNGRCDTIAADVEEVRDITNHKVDATTYTAEQAAQDTKINAAQAAANKANTNIGDWETDHPGQTIAQEVTRLNGAIPDVSGFVTETTYNQGQAAQDAKINAAQAAANKANTSIGDWDAQHPDQTIAQIDVRTYLDELFPENSVIQGTRLIDLYPRFYVTEQDEHVIVIPIIIPYIVKTFSGLWNQSFNAPASVTIYSANGFKQTRKVSNFEVNTTGEESIIFVHLESPFNIPAAGIYYFQMNSANGFVSYHWSKNNIKFAMHPLPGDDI